MNEAEAVDRRRAVGETYYRRCGKGVLDLALAAVLLIPLFPVLVSLGAIVWWASPHHRLLVPNIVMVIAVSLSAFLAPGVSGAQEKGAVVVDPRGRWVQEVLSAWQAGKEQREAAFSERLRMEDPYALYDAQLLIQNVLEWAMLEGNRGVLADIADLLAISVAPGVMRAASDGKRQWVCGSEGCLVFVRPAYKNKEVMLCSSQYLSMVAAWLAAAVAIPEGELTTNMRAGIREFSAITREHLMRWLTTGGYFERLGKFAEIGVHDPPEFRNAVHSTDMFVVIIAAELLRANDRASQVVTLSSDERRMLSTVVRHGERVVEQRSYAIILRDGSTAHMFDRGYWAEHEDYQYAGYEGEKHPEGLAPKRVSTVGWDISHFRRMVHLLLALERGRGKGNSTFSPRTYMAGYGNAVAQILWNGDQRRPRFRNFMDGSNGWYRVGYEGRKAFGYKPWKLSGAIASGGYGFLALESKTMRTRLAELYAMMTSTDGAIAAFQKEWGYAGNPVGILPTFFALFGSASEAGRGSGDPRLQSSGDRRE